MLGLLLWERLKVEDSFCGVLCVVEQGSYDRMVVLVLLEPSYEGGLKLLAQQAVRASMMSLI